MSDGINDGLDFRGRGPATEYDRLLCHRIVHGGARRLFLSERFPRITCLIGSSRFKAEFHKAGAALEKAGVLAIAMTFFQHADGVEVTEADRAVLDRLDYCRIDMADDVTVIAPPVSVCPVCNQPCNIRSTSMFESQCCGAVARIQQYIGESTRREIEYAKRTGKEVRYWEGKQNS